VVCDAAATAAAAAVCLAAGIEGHARHDLVLSSVPLPAELGPAVLIRLVREGERDAARGAIELPRPVRRWRLIGALRHALGAPAPPRRRSRPPYQVTVGVRRMLGLRVLVAEDNLINQEVTVGLRMVAEKLRGLPDFPPALRSLVEHMILSHHGQLEFGSPKVPQFAEALLLHYLDDLDSKMECMRALIDNDRQVEGCFTSFNPVLSRSALKKERFLNGKPEPPRVQVQAAASPDTPVAQPAHAAHSLFAPKPDSAFADKLKQALQPAGPKTG